MASLWWNWDEYALPSAAEDIGEVKQAIASSLPTLGYTGVQTGEDVHGVKGDYFLAVLYLYIGGRNFWQVVACVWNGGSQSGAEAEINKVKQMIKTLAFL
jgi:hypothetical protein